MLFGVKISYFRHNVCQKKTLIMGVDERIEKNRACCIKIIGQKAPIAIGIAEQAAADLSKPVLSGRAVRIISVVGDHLWSSGSKFIPKQEADPNFVQTEQQVEEETEKEENEEVGDEEQEEPEIQPEPIDVKKDQDDLLEYCFKVH